jgi:mannose-6-phosphate isomerase-like protein (cupin superfamily)
VKHFYEISELQAQRARIGKSYLEFLRIPAMSAGLYVLPAGGTDPQRPHKEDEMYYVVRGRARMNIGSEDQPVAAGSVIFVEAGVEHHFHHIEQDLEILVFFVPAESLS